MFKSDEHSEKAKLSIFVTGFETVTFVSDKHL